MKTQFRIHRLMLAGCLAATLFGGVQATANAAPAGYKSMTVRYDDLNLSNPKGVERLYARIRRAAKAVCSDPGGASLPAFRYQAKRCADQAIDAAVKSVNNRILTAMHDQKSNRNLG